MFGIDVAQAQESVEQDQQEAAPDAAEVEPFAYVAVFEGVEGKLENLLKQVSETQRLANRPPISFSRLRRRVQDDRPRLLQALRARAHYAATVEVEIDRATSPITVTFRIDSGPVYRFDDVVIELTPPTEDDLELPSPKKLNLKKGKRASSIKIVEAEAELLRRVKEQGFFFAEIGERRAIVDHNDRTMDLTLRLVPGNRAFFGDIEVVGNVDVEPRFITRRVPWKPGEKITPLRLEQIQFDLLDTGLFNMVRVEPGAKPDERGRVAVKIEVTEAKHRSIEAGVRYRSDEGLGGNIGWQHRNLFGTGEQFGVQLDGSAVGWQLSGEAREPDFLKRRQALVVKGEIVVENTEAFDSRSIGASVGIERSVGRGMDLAIGGAFRALTVEQEGDNESFGLLSLPASFSWDRSNNLLDPSKGGRLFVNNEPFVDVFGNDVAFNKTSIGYAHYVRVSRKPRLILAGRVKAGFLFGATRDNVPADERFYAGGGGSVRGIGFQLAGELDDGDKPIGGRSLLEFAGELRGRFTETLGAAIFADSGVAYASTVPDFQEDLRIGVGGGLRYFSPIGPLRLDIGFPLNRRSSDDAFQIYVSIGQAF